MNDKEIYQKLSEMVAAGRVDLKFLCNRFRAQVGGELGAATMHEITQYERDQATYAIEHA